MLIEEINLDIDYHLLLQTFNDLKVVDLMEKNTRQISVQHRGVNNGKQLTEGCQSLKLDWDKFDPKIHSEPPEREIVLDERDFIYTCDLFKDNYIGTVTELLRNKYSVFRGRFMMMKYKSCMSMHVDTSKRLHIPLITNPDAYMIIDKTMIHLEFGKTYITNTLLPHTAMNSGKKDRIHLVFCI